MECALAELKTKIYNLSDQLQNTNMDKNIPKIILVVINKREM